MPWVMMAVRWVGQTVLFVGAAMLLALPAQALTRTGSFETTRWSASVDVRRDGTVRVDHVIAVRFPEPRHGIYLDLPAEITYRRDGATPTLTLAYEDVTAGDRPVAVAHGASVTRIRVGDPDERVADSQEYHVGYTVRGAITDTSATQGRLAAIPVVEPSWDGPIPSFGLQISSAYEGTRACIVSSSSVSPGAPCTTGIPAGGPLPDDEGVWATIDFVSASIPLTDGTRPAPQDVDALLRPPEPSHVAGIAKIVGTILLAFVGVGVLIWRLPTVEPGSGGGSSSSTDTGSSTDTWSSTDSWSSSDSGSSDSGSDSGSSDPVGSGGGDW